MTTKHKMQLKPEKVMTSKHKMQLKPEKNLPIPLVLFTSYIAAEKSDELIKVFCKELPDILKNINNCKKALENRTETVYKLKEGIKHDLKKLELANIVLKELYKEEEASKVEKEKELQILHSEISICQGSKKLLKRYLAQFTQSKQVLDAIAVESNRYEDAQSLIQTYLTLQAVNEKLIEDEFECGYNVKNTEERKLELQQMLFKQKYDIMAREKILENLLREYESVKNENFKLNNSLNEIYSAERHQHMEWMHLKRWAYDTCQKLGAYKETSLCSQEFLKLLNEVQEFIVFSKRTILKFETQETKTC